MSAKPRPKTIITAHNNADYDALAAMVAAGKLYPNALLIAPATQERQATHYFTDSIAYLFSLRQPRDVDFSGVKTLVVVDTRQKSRIRHVEAVFANPGLEIHLYDHHPDAEDDLTGAICVVKPWGSCTAILVDLMKERGVLPTSDEATMLGLGIYEDTGSFLYSSTTTHDLAAAAWLREQRMDLEIVSELISRDLTREQILVLNTLLESAQTHDIKGIPVLFAEASLDFFLGDFAVLAQKIMDLEQVKVLFALARMGDRVQVVARSRLAEVDVGKICASIGGGGHSYAASASVKDKTLAEVKAELLALLLSSVNPHVTVGEHMTSPVIGVDDNQTIAQAEEIMTRFGLKAVPILAAGTRRCVGYLEQQTAARAMAHGLGELGVTEYMHRSVQTVSPESTLFPAMEIILTQRQRLVPVVENGEVVGVLTRTDIMRLLVGDAMLRIPEGTPLDAAARERNIGALVKERLPAEHVELLALAGKLGDSLNCGVFAVGGFVRDLLLSRPNLDIDLSVEGDGIAFAKLLAAKLKGRVRPHYKFKTAVVVFTNKQGEEQRIDVATARLEYYEHPGALPTVELSSIKMDLSRRDFTINALAVQLNASRFGVLIDPFGAQRDIKEKTVNVLHSLSLIEDPTRIMRGIRFESRYDFKFGPQTERLAKNALQLGMLQRVSGVRLCNELRHMFDEHEAVKCIQRMEQFDIWRLIHPLLKLQPSKVALLKEMEDVLAWYRRMYMGESPQTTTVFLLILLRGAKHQDIAAVLNRLGFIQKAKTDFLRLREALRHAQIQLPSWKNEDGSMSGLYTLLCQMPVEGILVLIALTAKEPFNKDIAHFLTRLHMEKPDITGADLAELGEVPGPVFGRVLSQVLAAKLDGKVKSRDEQLALAAKLLSAVRGGKPAPLALGEVLNGRL